MGFSFFPNFINFFVFFFLKFFVVWLILDMKKEMIYWFFILKIENFYLIFMKQRSLGSILLDKIGRLEFQVRGFLNQVFSPIFFQKKGLILRVF